MSNLYLNVDQCLELGIFAKTFRRPSVNEIFDTIAGYGLGCVQWNWSCVPGLPSLPESVPAEVLQSIRSAAASSGVNICAVSATFNLIEQKAFRMGLSRLPELARAAIAIGCDQLTLCTGTRHPNDMWRHHPANRLRDAWDDMIDGLRQVSRIAKSYGIRLAIEPEAANVVCDAEAAERALQELGMDAETFSIVLDAANLYRPPLDPREDCAIVDDAVARLGERISLAHAKDIADPALAPTSGNDAEGYGHVAAGTGILPYPRYLEALLRTPKAIAAAANGKRLPLVLHGLDEAQVPASIEFLRECMSAASLGVR